MRGQLGYPHTENIGDDPNDAITDLPLANVVAISAGGAHTCALLANDAIYCWGRGVEGQLGLGTMDDVRPAGSMGPVQF